MPVTLRREVLERVRRHPDGTETIEDTQTTTRRYVASGHHGTAAEQEKATMVTTTQQTTTTKHTIVGVFDGPNHAEQALSGLQAAGFTPEQVSVVAQDKRDMQQLADKSDMAGEGAATGAVTGGSSAV